MTFVEVNDCRFHYSDAGEGPVLLLIHGEGHGIEYFEHQVEYFRSTHRVITYARRGHGQTETPRYGYSLHNQTRDVVHLLDALDIDEPVDILGIAFGSVVAYHLALEWPERVCRLVLVAWSELQDCTPYIEHFRAQTPVFEELIAAGGVDAVLEHVLAGGRDVSPVLPAEEPRRTIYARWLAERSPSALAGRLELVASVPVLTRRAAEIRAPMLGVEGTRDPFPCDPALLSVNPGFRQEYLEGDRFVQWEESRQFNTLVGEFLATGEQANG